MQEFSFTASDGQILKGFFYPSEQAKATLIIGSALGVPQQFYKHYSNFMSKQGYQCLSFDYRGIGLSKLSGKGANAELAHWGSLDVEAAIIAAKKLSKEHKVDDSELYYMGHSIGGQLLGLAPSSASIKACMFVGVSAPYWKRWPYPRKIFMNFVSYGILPVLSFARNVFPAKAVGLSSINIPAGCASDWGKWMRDPDYLFGKKFKLNLSGYERINSPILSLCFDDDDFAPHQNVEHILAFFSNAETQNQLVKHGEVNLGNIDHMGYFRAKFEHSLWPMSLDHFALS
ncbi:MAG: alpha/beta hydrolase [Bermanella sp.]